MEDDEFFVKAKKLLNLGGRGKEILIHTSWWTPSKGMMYTCGYVYN